MLLVYLLFIWHQKVVIIFFGNFQVPIHHGHSAQRDI